MSQPSFGATPRGLEVLVTKASVDGQFRALLLQSRAEAAAEISLELTPAETLLLNAVPAEQLDAVIARTSVPDEHRRAFLGRAAAAMLAALAAMAPPIASGGISARSRSGGAASGGMRIDRPANTASKTKQPNDRLPVDVPPEVVENRVLAVVARRFKVERKKLTRKTSFVKDLKAQPADLAKLKTDLENEFHLKIPGKAYKEIRTVGQAVDYLEGVVSGQGPTDSPRPNLTRGIQPDRPPQRSGGTFGNRPD
jgi:acyl carrier protein